MHSGSRRFELGDRGIIAVAANDLIGHCVHIYLMIGEFSMPPRYTCGWVSHQEHAYVGIWRHNGCDVPSLSDDPADGLGDELPLPCHQVSANIEICRH